MENQQTENQKENESLNNHNPINHISKRKPITLNIKTLCLKNNRITTNLNILYWDNIQQKIFLLRELKNRFLYILNNCFKDLNNGDYQTQYKFINFYQNDILRYLNNIDNTKNDKATLINRRGDIVSEKYPEFLGNIDLPDCFLDGEMIVEDENGLSVFNGGIDKRAHNKSPDVILSASKQYPVTYVVFDILELNDKNLRQLSLKERKECLRSINVESIKYMKEIKYSFDIIEMWKNITAMGGEGLVIKDINSLYFEGKRVKTWIKVKDIEESILNFIKYSTHPKGIRVETENNIAITVNGHQSLDVINDIETKGKSIIEIRHLGQTETGKFRQPVFFRRVENEIKTETK